MTKILIFDAFTLLICKKNVANYALLRCKTISLKIWLCNFFDKYHVFSPQTCQMLQILQIYLPDLDRKYVEEHSYCFALDSWAAFFAYT